MGGEMQRNTALAAVASQLSRLTLTARATDYNPHSEIPYQRAVRPGLGTQGRSVTVLANHFLLSLRAKQAFHYDVASELLERVRDGPTRNFGALHAVLGGLGALLRRACMCIARGHLHIRTRRAATSITHQ